MEAIPLHQAIAQGKESEYKNTNFDVASLETTSTKGGLNPKSDNDDGPDEVNRGEAMESGGHQLAKLYSWIDHPNICDDLEQELLDEIGQRVKREYDIDVQSRQDWMDKSVKAMELAIQVAQEKQYPWPKASNVIFPLMTNAAIQFAARAYPAIIQNRNVVRGTVVGRDDGRPAMNQYGQPMPDPQNPGQPQWIEPPGTKRLRADRIGQHMSFQLLDEMPEWQADTDKLLHILPIAGAVFRKTYFDPALGRNMSVLVLATDLVISYMAKSLDLAPRLTEEIKFYPREIKEKELAGVFKKVDYTFSPDAMGDEDAAVEFIEQHRFWDLDKDGYTEPYIMTVHKQSSKVVRIVARFDHDGIKTEGPKVIKIDPVQYYTQFNFLPSMDGGIYGIGFGQLLAPINHAVNTSLNMLIDAGHLSNTGGGFIGKGLSMNTGAVRFQPGEYKMVNVSGSTVKESIVPLEFPGPSPVLFNLLGLLIECGKDVASVKDVLTGEQQNGNVPATTTMALIEQGLKVFTGIYKRVYLSLKNEYTKLYRLNRIYLTEEASYKVGENWKFIQRQDYDYNSGVEPIADPTMISDFQKMSRAQFLMTFVGNPMINSVEVLKRVFDAAMIDEPDKLINPSPPQDHKMIAKGLELEIKGKRETAAEIRDLSQAVLNLAQADVAVGDHHLDWLEQQLGALQQQYEMGSNVQDDHPNAPALPAPAGPSASGGGGGPGPGAAPQMPPPDISSIPGPSAGPASRWESHGRKRTTVADALDKINQTTQLIHEHIHAPRQILRDAHGNITHVKIGHEHRPVIRNEHGHIIGMLPGQQQ